MFYEGDINRLWDLGPPALFARKFPTTPALDIALHARCGFCLQDTCLSLLDDLLSCLTVICVSQVERLTQCDANGQAAS